MIVPNHKQETYAKAREKFLDYWAIRVFDLKTCEMGLATGEVKSTNDSLYNFFNPNHNTRHIFPTEWVCEFDKPTNSTLTNEEFQNEFSIIATCQVCLNLIDMKIHFSVWFADNMESPHVRIYDLLPECLPEQQQRKLREMFMKKVVPYEFQPFFDKALLSRHKVCLEWSKHWKYGTHLNLILEYKP